MVYKSFDDALKTANVGGDTTESLRSEVTTPNLISWFNEFVATDGFSGEFCLMMTARRVVITRSYIAGNHPQQVVVHPRQPVQQPTHGNIVPDQQESEVEENINLREVVNTLSAQLTEALAEIKSLKESVKELQNSQKQMTVDIQACQIACQKRFRLKETAENVPNVHIDDVFTAKDSVDLNLGRDSVHHFSLYDEAQDSHIEGKPVHDAIKMLLRHMVKKAIPREELKQFSTRPNPKKLSQFPKSFVVKVVRFFSDAYPKDDSELQKAQEEQWASVGEVCLSDCFSHARKRDNQHFGDSPGQSAPKRVIHELREESLDDDVIKIEHSEQDP